MKIALLNFHPVINTSGGLEKIFFQLGNNLSKEHQVTLLYYDPNKGEPFFTIESNITKTNLFATSTFTKAYFFFCKYLSYFFLLKRIRTYIFNKLINHQKHKLLRHNFNKNNYDLIILFQPHMIPLLPPKRNKTILTLHNAPSDFDDLFSTKKFNQLLNYPDIITVLLPGFKSNIEQRTTAKTIVIPNFIDNLFTIQHNPNAKKIIYVARLAPRKQHELLIYAFDLIKDRIPDWTLEIWGSTSTNKKYYLKIQTLIKQLKLRNKVICCGESKNIGNELAKAQICVFPSKAEGFGLSLLEAMAVGLPCIGLKDSPGVNEIIQHKYNGLLVKNTKEDLANEILQLINNPKLQKELSTNAKKFAQNYSITKVIPLWEQLINRL